MMRFVSVFFILAILVLNGCSPLSRPVPVEERSTGAAAPASQDTTAPESVPAGEAEPGRERPAGTPSSASSPAVVAMLEEADARLRAGHDAAAVSSLERALTLEPKNPYLWHRLAAVRLQQQDWQQAYVLANKSNSLVHDNPSLKIRNWKIIAAAKRRQGDSRAAQEAEQTIRQFSEE